MAEADVPQVSCVSDESFDGNLVKTVAQYVQSIVDFSSQYGTDTSMSYAAVNLVGKPNVYPSYGDFTMAYLLRTFGPWWINSPCAPLPFKERRHHQFYSQDFVELKFENRVYPTKINIFETYNPGAVVRIFACNTAKFTWVNLWSGKAQPTYLEEARVFSPPLRRVNFPTNLIRIEFHHLNLDYYAGLDAVSLVGIPETVAAPLVAASSLVAYVYPADQTGLNVVCNQLECLSISLPPSLKLPVRARASSPTDTRSRTNYFEFLPSEVVHLIVNYLDLVSLCRTACTCRLLQRHCYDPLLYTELDLQPYWNIVNETTLLGLETRCQNIRRLSLSWCGDLGTPSVAVLIKFLNACGSRLECVRLSNCKAITNEVLKTLVNVAQNLEELDLQSSKLCRLDSVGFQEIGRCRKLKWLNLYRSAIDSHSIIIIIRHCPSLEFLGLGNCNGITNFDEVAQNIGQCCSNIKGLDFWRARTLTALGVRIIANKCNKLQELDIGWCFDVCSSNGCLIELAQKCCSLKKLILTALRTTCDNDIMALVSNCPDLEQLDILGTRDVTIYSISRLLTSCQRLKYIDVSFCGLIDMGTVFQWQRLFPKVEFQKSQQKMFCE